MLTFPSGLSLEIPLLVAVVSGLFSLLGGFVGAWLARRSEYEKWLRQERSAAFAEFLRQLHDIRQKSIDFIHSAELSERERETKVTELFVGLNGQENIVRLYLQSKDRARFSKLKKELWLLHSSVDGQKRRVNQVDEILSEVQAIFERSLHG